MSYLVVCMINLPIIWQGSPNYANVELKGYEVKELNDKYSMVDFTASFKALPYAYDGNTVLRVKMNDCKYLGKEDVLKFNNL